MGNELVRCFTAILNTVPYTTTLDDIVKHTKQCETQATPEQVTLALQEFKKALSTLENMAKHAVTSSHQLQPFVQIHKHRKSVDKNPSGEPSNGTAAGH